MNLKTRIATFATAAILAVSASTGVLADNTVTQEIGTNSGALTAYIDDGSLTTMPFSLEAQTGTGTLDLHVKDLSGSYDGWNVRVSASNFERDGGNADPIASSRFAYTGHGSVRAVQGSAENLQFSDQNGTFDRQLKVLRADKGWGTGEYIMPMNVQLAIPAAQPAGTYTSTMTVTIATGPGN